MTQFEKVGLGMAILAKYKPSAVVAEHDIIIIYTEGYAEGNTPVSLEDDKELTRLGWFLDDDGWRFFT